MEEVLVKIIKTEDFAAWYKSQDKHTRRIVDARLTRIEQEEHFGTVRRFEDLTELKWTSGIRVYTAVIKPNVFVLLGGNKNGQEKDIKRAKNILAEIVSAQPQE